MEFVHGGTLTEVLGPTIDFPEPHIAFVCKQMLMGLSYLHRSHRLHRDIKSDNILVSFQGHVKLADVSLRAVPAVSQASHENPIVSRLLPIPR